jgi:hypothetical protein
MARRESHVLSATRPEPDLGEERARDAGPVTDHPTTGTPPSGAPTTDAPTTDPPTTGTPTPDAPTSDPPPFDPPATEAPAPDTPATAPPPDDLAGDEHPAGSASERPRSTSSWLGWGAFSGLLAGLAFLALNSWFAMSTGQDAAAPLRRIATIAEGPPPMEAVEGVGVVVHAVLSAVFGLVFAALLLPLRRRSAGWFAWAGLLFGGAVYLVDFQVFARSVPWFSAFRTTNQPLELAAHLVFGSVLAALLLLAKPRTTRRRQTR